MTSASDTTARLKQRVLYADKIIQQTMFDRGLKNHIVLEGGNSSHGATSYTPFYNWRGGAANTTQAEVDSYIASVPGNASGPSITVPGAPTGVSAVAGNAEAVITFTAPTNTGGAPITGYKVTSSPATTTVIGSSSPITVTGLTNGVSYTFAVVAVNSVGDSAASVNSSAVTPTAPIPRTAGLATLATSFYDNANLGYTSLYGNFSKLTTDSATNTIVGGLYRTGTFTLNKPDTDGITQIATLTETFDGTTSFTQGPTTYYMNNIFVAKYSNAGVPIWSAKISGTSNAGATLYGVACDSQNNIYAYIGVGGSTATPNVISFYNSDNSVFATKSNTFGFGFSIPAGYFLVKYNASGIIQWINSITAGDNNNQYVLANTGDVVIDGLDNVYVTTQLQRAGGGTGPTSIKFYKYSSVSSGVLQDTLVTSDSAPFTAEYHRGHLVKLDSTGTYSWIARMVIPSAYGENNGGGRNGNIAIDGNNNVYVCQNVQINASSPICNIYSGVAASSNPLPALAAPYYRYDLRGNSISPSLSQYYRYVASFKFDSNGVFQGACGAHQLINGSVSLDMAGFIEINKATNEIYMTVNAQGFVGNNTGTGPNVGTNTPLDKLYIDNFSSNVANGSNFDITVANAITVSLAQPQTILAVVKFNASLQAVSVAYIDTPGGNAGTASGFYGTPSPISIDSSGNVYIVTTIKGTSATNTINTFDSLSGSNPVFNTFATINATGANADGLMLSYNGALTTGRWATITASSDGLNDNGFACKVNSDDYIFVGGNAVLNNAAGSNTIAINSYSGVTGGAIQNTAFGNLIVTDAIDRVGFLVKYE